VRVVHLPPFESVRSWSYAMTWLSPGVRLLASSFGGFHTWGQTLPDFAVVSPVGFSHLASHRRNWADPAAWSCGARSALSIPAARARGRHAVSFDTQSDCDQTFCTRVLRPILDTQRAFRTLSQFLRPVSKITRRQRHLAKRRVSRRRGSGARSRNTLDPIVYIHHRVGYLFAFIRATSSGSGIARLDI